jgi:plasmid stability protein
LTIRNVDAAIKERLRVRAAHNGRSMEAKLRHILIESGREPNLAEAIRRRFAPLAGVDLNPHRRVPVGEPPNLTGDRSRHQHHFRLDAGEHEDLWPDPRAIGDGSR